MAFHELQRAIVGHGLNGDGPVAVVVIELVEARQEDAQLVLRAGDIDSTRRILHAEERVRQLHAVALRN